MTPSVRPSSDARPESEPLQFARAEFAEAAADVACTACAAPIRSEYFEVNTAVVCRNCRNAVSLIGTEGTSLSRFTRALAAGGAAATAGWLVYYAIAESTGYEFGLIAVAIGFAVGSAVKWGCYGRGGVRYQLLAMMLTYFAIVFTYVPAIIEGLQNADAAEEIALPAADTQGATSPVAAQQVAVPQKLAAAPAAGADEELTLGGFLIGIGLIVVLASIAPFLVGVQNIIGLLIIAIGLWEAWKINKRPVFTISGPHAIATRPAAPSAVPAV